MAEHKSHRIRIDHLPQTKPLCTVTTKSRVTVVCAWVIAFIVCLSKSFLAIPFVFLALVLTANKGKTVYAGYDDRFVIYEEDDQQFCQMLWHSDISGWEYRITDKCDKLYLYTTDGETIKLSNYINRQLYGYFDKTMGDRQIRRNNKV